MAQGDINRNIVAALSYFLGFITGAIILFVEKDDKYVRFHAMQSTVIFGAFFILNLLVSLLFSNFTFLNFLVQVFTTILTVITVVVWIVSMIKAYQGVVFKWPIAGKFAEKWTGKAS